MESSVSDSSSKAKFTTRLKKKLKEYLFVLLIAVFAALFLKTFFIEAYKIPTASMKDTLLEGDFIVVNKLLYGANTPVKFPLFGFTIPPLNMPGFKEPERNEIIVFKFPGNKDEIVAKEEINYIKRIIGLPGDTVRIVRKQVFINDQQHKEVKTLRLNNSKEGKLFNEENNIFPLGKNWNEDNYGPVIVPKKGMKILLDLYNINDWKTIIERDAGKRCIEIQNGNVLINSEFVNEYIFKNDYFFVLGDNRDDSLDSRFWGFVSRDLIVGRAELIYWSVEDELNSSLIPVRWNRILNFIK